jgi:hypothetical protein
VKGQKGWSIEDNLTLDGIQWAGDHTIKMGVKYKQIDLYASDAAQINPTFYYSLDDPTSRTASVQGTVREAGHRRDRRVRRSAFEGEADRSVHPG